jgi:RimJ/RimL family protein N-acetyltransferase
MSAQVHDSPADVASIVRDVYHRDPVSFTMELTSLPAGRLAADQTLLSIDNGDRVIGAALHRTGSKLLVSGLPPASATEAAAALAPVDLVGVRGTPSTATAFSQAWVDVAGASADQSRIDTLYRLGDFSPTGGVAGASRTAGHDDEELVAGWLDAFGVEAMAAPSDATVGRDTFRKIAAAGGQLALWTIDGEPVAMARAHAPALGVCRIGPVFTPPRHRGNGYGAAVTTAAVRHALESGARDVVLFADVANAGSNRIYRRLGFLPVDEHVEYEFSA